MPHGDLHKHVERSFNRGAAQLAISLRDVRIANGEECAFDRNRIEHDCARPNPPIIDVTTVRARRDGVYSPLNIRRDAGCPKVRPHWYPYTCKCGLACASSRIDDPAWRRVFSRIIVSENGFRIVCAWVDRINRYALFLANFLVKIAPVRSKIGPIEKARAHFEIAHFDEIARPGAFDVNRTGHNVDAGIAVRFWHVVIELADFLVHQEIRRIPCVMRHGFDTNEITAGNAQRWRKRCRKIPPVHGFLGRAQIVKHGVSLPAP